MVFGAGAGAGAVGVGAGAGAGVELGTTITVCAGVDVDDEAPEGATITIGGGAEEEDELAEVELADTADPLICDCAIASFRASSCCLAHSKTDIPDKAKMLSLSLT